MTAIYGALASILAITGVVWLARALLAAPLCPICLGVGGTWLWMAVARELGYPVDATVLAMLLGASVVGVAYLVEKRLPSGRSPLLWKTLFIPSGLLAASLLVARQWVVFGAMLLGLALLAALFLRQPGTSSESGGNVDDLTRRMRDCC